MQDLLQDAVSDVNQLRECKLVQVYPRGSSYDQMQWFTGRLCTIAPKLDTSLGIQVGMTCMCLSKACQLAYIPFVDFVYTPPEYASNIAMLQKSNVFYPEKILTNLFSASDKLSIARLLQRGNIRKQDTIVDILSKAVEAMQNWVKRLGVSKSILASMPDIHLKEYLSGDLRLAPVVKNKLSANIHPYVRSLVSDFMGSMQSVTILDALVNTLQQNGRQLTFIPAGRQDTQDKITIIPQAIAEIHKGDEINPQDILTYSLGANPLQRIRQPDKIFVKAAYSQGWGSQDTTGSMGKFKLASLVGQYSLLDDNSVQRIKLLYAPDWIFDILLQGTYDDAKTNTLVHKSLYAANKSTSSGSALTPLLNYQEVKQVLDAYAKNLFFSTYRLHTHINLKLAITEDTLDLDTKLGKSIQLNIPTSAKEIVDNDTRCFYGRLQDITYSYQSSKTVKSASSISLYCTVTGLTSEESQGKTLFQEGNNILYTNSEAK